MDSTHAMRLLPQRDEAAPPDLILALLGGPGSGDPACLEGIEPAMTVTRLSLTGSLDGVADGVHAVVVDGTEDIGQAAKACRGPLQFVSAPVLLIVAPASLAVLKASWGFADWMVADASSDELATRLRIAIEIYGPKSGAVHRAGPLAVDIQRFSVTVRGVLVNLTYTEFALLVALMRRRGRVYPRNELMRDVWQQVDPAASRTLDVHIRRLRAKLGPEVSGMITTTHKVGYMLANDPDPPATL